MKIKYLKNSVRWRVEVLVKGKIKVKILKAKHEVFKKNLLGIQEKRENSTEESLSHQ